MSAGTQPMLWQSLLSPTARPGRPFGLLDVGSRKVCCYVVRVTTAGRFDVLGAGHQAAEGFRAGEIVDASAAEAAVRAVVDEAENAAGERLSGIAVTLPGGDPASGFLRVEVALGGRPVTRRDLRCALENACDEVLADGFVILHAIPLGESLDGGPEVRDVTGLVGKRLAVRTHLVGTAQRPIELLHRCLDRCHLEMTDVVAAPYAAGVATLTKDEAHRGVVVVDCGARTTTLGFFRFGRIQYVAAIPFGGDHLTEELAMRLDVSWSTAERLKSLEASVAWRACDSFETIELQPSGPANAFDTVEIPRRRLTDFLRPPAEALVNAMSEHLAAAPAPIRAACRRGIVLTGGAAQMDGLVELTADMLGSGVRLGRPAVLQGWQDPALAAASGGLALVAGWDGGVGFAGRRSRRPLAGSLESLGQWLRESLGAA